ncbi:Alpha/Beta hydrolase protein [Gorgonomyces haynaldii]|nr:Alpha/Beta hydrolase protein [Gorgonomyces haynaldii]
MDTCHVFEFAKEKAHMDPKNNALILLHGFGDNAQNFKQFGLKMQLPQTKVISLEAQCPVPFMPEVKGWFPKFSMDGEELNVKSAVVKSGLDKSRQEIIRFLKENVLGDGKDRFPPERVFFLGFSQGGTMAVDVGLNLKIGGVISISGWVEPEWYQTTLKTPVLITQGTDLTPASLEKKIQWLKDRTEFQAKFFKKQHEMPKTREEMQSIMEFFAKRLYLRQYALENHPDIIEVTP